jgi:hypothetical protein
MIDPVKIDPDHLFDDSALRMKFGLSPTALAAARRAGTLRYVKVGTRMLYRGSWLLAWLEREAAPATTEPRASQAHETATT